MLGGKDVRRAGIDVGAEPLGAMRVTLSSRYAISGTVVDRQGRPVAGAMVVLVTGASGVRGSAMTNEKGIFNAWLADPGDYRVVVAPSSLDFASDSEDYVAKHQADYPVLHAVNGDNVPLNLVLKAN